MIDNLFDVEVDNVHMVKVDSYEAAQPTKPAIPMATEKQLKFMKRLFLERQNNEEAMILRQHLLGEHKSGKLTRVLASQAIDDILMMERDKPNPQSTSVELDHGQVWIDNQHNFVKVCLNQQGTSFYGKVWNPHNLEWVYVPQALTNLDHLVTAEEAKEFSLQWEAENRYCIFCMKHLSDPRSEYAGYGETCAKNRNLPWGETA